MINYKIWPASSQKELLRATFLDGQEGSEAFEKWKSQVDMADHPDFGSFRLLPFLFHQLIAQGIDDPIMMKLKGIARQNWYKNQRFFSNVGPTMLALHKVGIECILLYGPAFALNYYRDYALGAEMNLSIFVPSEQVWTAITKLQELGWQPEKQFLEDSSLTLFLAANWRYTFQDTTGTKINLYWHLLPSCRTVEADTNFWDRSIATVIHEVPVHILNPADQILHTCVEDYSSHGLSNFLRAIDVIVIIKTTPKINWNHLIGQAEKHDLVVPLLTVLSYIQNTLESPLPPDVLQRLRSLPVSWLQRLEHRLRMSHSLLCRRFWQLWFDYRRHTKSVSLIQGIFGFPQYLQHFWRLSNLYQVPSQALLILLHQLRRRSFLSRIKV